MPRIDHMTAFHLALDLVKRAGFELSHVSGITETCYYRHPSRPEHLLRVSTHRTKRGPMGMNGVVAKVTFTRKDKTLTETLVMNRMKWAIGEYFLGEQKPSRYLGKRGTWENVSSQTESP